MANYCLVADMLGFQKIILNANPDQRDERVRDWIALVKNAASSAGAQHQLISDTVFAVTKPDAEGLRAILKLSKRLLEEALDNSFPLRLAVTFGQVTWTDELVFSPSIVEAYQLETNQDWIGGTCSTNIPDLDSCGDLLVTYPVPMKSGAVMLRPAIQWHVPPSWTIGSKTVAGNLTRAGDLLEYSWARKIVNTALFGLYLQLVKLAGANPNKFMGLNSVQLIETIVAEVSSSTQVTAMWTDKLRNARPSLFE